MGSILANKLGFMPVVAAGSIISSTGLFLSYFAEDFFVLFLTFGIITGRNEANELEGKRKNVEMEGIDPPTSYMLSKRSTI